MVRSNDASGSGWPKTETGHLEKIISGTHFWLLGTLDNLDLALLSVNLDSFSCGRTFSSLSLKIYDTSYTELAVLDHAF